jgi:hypothetical protein
MCDCGTIEIVPDREQQHFTVRLREAFERRLYCVNLRRRISRDGLGRHLGEPCCHRLLSPDTPTNVESDVPGNADEPWPCVGRNVVEPPPGDEERFSDHVVCQGRVAPPDIAADCLEMLFMKTVEPIV